MTIPTKGKHMPDQEMGQFHDRRMALLNGTRIDDGCEHDVPWSEFCQACIVKANADRLYAVEKRLETIEEGLYTVLKEHYRTLHYRATDDMPLSKYDKAEIERLLPILKALRDMVVVP